MHILLITQSFDKGGRTRRICDLTKQLESRGHTVSLCVFEAPLDWIKNQFPRLTDIHFLDASKSGKLSMIRKMSALVAKLSPDIIHSNCEKSYLFGGVAGRLFRIPVVGTYHRSNLEFYQPTFKYKLFASLMSRCVAISTQRIALMQDQLGIAPGKITLIHGGVDLSIVNNEEKRAAKAKIGFDPDQPMLLSLGHLGEIKGHDYTLAGLESVVSRFPNVHLYIGGDGQPADYQRLRTLIQKYRLQNHVTLLGEVTNAFELFAACDVFVQPSLEEAFGLVFIEAGAHGKPTVATEVGGIPDIIINNETGVLVPPGDGAAIGLAINKMLENPEWTDQLGINARERIVAHFSLDRMVDKYIGVYEGMLK
ncbi:MAG: glycosyltransferase family 4 protein [Pseudomonadota bacterium]